MVMTLCLRIVHNAVFNTPLSQSHSSSNYMQLYINSASYIHINLKAMVKSENGHTSIYNLNKAMYNRQMTLSLKGCFIVIVHHNSIIIEFLKLTNIIASPFCN